MKKIFIIIIFVVSSVYLIADDIDAIYDPIITPIYTGRTLFCSVMTDDIDKTPCDPESRHIVYSTNVIDTIQGVMLFWIHFETIIKFSNSFIQDLLAVYEFAEKNSSRL